MCSNAIVKRGNLDFLDEMLYSAYIRTYVKPTSV